MKVQAYAALERGQSLTSWSYESQRLQPDEVLLRVRACGICHSDIHMIDNDWQISHYPIVPGHEVVAEVLEIGSSVTHLRAGARVGVGWQRSACLHCPDCLKGDENLCAASTGVISHGRGGFADHLVMDSRFCFALPDDLATNVAAPLLCAGITVYAALRAAGMRSGQQIGIIGVGGLGHLAVQFASKLGNRVTVFTTTDDKAEHAARLGAHEAIIVRRGELSAKPARPLDLILSTVPTAIPCDAYLNLLGSDGTLSFVGVPDAPLTIPVNLLLAKRRRVMASPIGGRAAMVEMLETAARFGIQPLIETFPLGDVNTALTKVRRNTVRYRAVLTA
jgi:uncharacterized zinc-type alcohol dehydrogenase-like protein